MASANARSNVDNELGFIEVQVSEMQDTEALKKTSLIHQWLWINTQDIAEKTKFSEVLTSTLNLVFIFETFFFQRWKSARSIFSTLKMKEKLKVS